jgi:hypothetical protein
MTVFAWNWRQRRTALGRLGSSGRSCRPPDFFLRGPDTLLASISQLDRLSGYTEFLERVVKALPLAEIFPLV